MFDTKKIPLELHGLIFLAERFGIADDSERLVVLKSSSPEEIALLKQAILQHDDQLDAWLAGPESYGPEFSDEYIAFSAMRMAADRS